MSWLQDRAREEGGWLRGGHGSWRGGRGGASRRGAGGSYSRGRSNVSYPKDPSSSSQASVLQASLDDFCPYPGWKLYFPFEVYCESGEIVPKVQAFEMFFNARLELYNKDEIEEKGSILVDYKELVEDKCLTIIIPTLANRLAKRPDRVLQYMGLAVHQTLRKDLESQVMQLQQQAGLQQEEAPTVNVPLINVRIYNYEPLTQLKNLRANCYGKLVAIHGTVVRVGNIKPMCTRLTFFCSACGANQALPLPYGKFALPTKCADVDCRSRAFMPNRRSRLTETVAWQMIKVQELMDGQQRQAGRVPRTVECELTRDLVDTCLLGDVITLTGIVKVTSSDEGRNKCYKDKCMFLLYIQGVAVCNTKGQRSDGAGDETAPGVALELTLKDLYAVQEIQAQPNLFRLLVHSICPTIYGHELMKAGLVLTLFGGVQHYLMDNNRIPVRGEPHVLIVGAPGIGKSQILQAVCNIAPRGVYVCGNTSTTAGLTVTLSKDGPSGDSALEAGALVLGDQGVCCIDEFDKMPNQHQGLLEAMEQQRISLAKAGVVCCLPARTSVVAAANPVCGHYNKSKTVSENLQMGSALLSCFDLVFILVDTPDQGHDHVLSEHVIAMHSGKRLLAGASVSRAAAPGMDIAAASASSDDIFDGLSLPDRLKAWPVESLDPVPHPLLRKYVGYAQRYVRPHLSAAAADALLEFYTELRRQHRGEDGTPITTRQLESLIRLTQARARLELREEATKGDADDVIEIMKHSFLDTFSDELGTLHFERSQHGYGTSNRSVARRFLTALTHSSEQTGSTMFTVQQLQQLALELGPQVADFEGFISSLNTQGFLLQKGSKVYQLQAM